MISYALLGIVLAQNTTATPSLVAVPTPPPSPLAAPAPRRMRRFGLHLGLNATLTFDAAFGAWFYGGLTTQLTGIGALFDSQRNYVVSILAFGGVAIPLVDRPSVRFTVDLAPMASYFHAAPVNMLSAGLLAGLRFLHSSGFTVALKLPLVGYAGAPDAQRGGPLYYYTGAIATVPALTLGYTF